MRVRQEIPLEIMRLIKGIEHAKTPSGHTRYYPYFEMQGGNRDKLALSVVAVRNGVDKKGRKPSKCLYVKKVTVHTVEGAEAYERDVAYSTIGGYRVDWHREQRDENHSNENSFWQVDYKYARLFRYRKILNLDFLRQFPEYAHSGYSGDCDILEYLAAYKANPQIEYISKIVSSRVAKSKQIASLCAKDKGFIAFLKRSKGEINDGTAIRDIIDAYKHGCTVNEMQKLKNTEWFWVYYYGHRRPLAFMDIILKRGEPFKEKVRAYLSENQISPDSFNDYVKTCKFLKIDLTDSKNLFPNDFNYWNKLRLNQYAAKKNQKLDAEIAGVAQKYAALAGAEGAYCAILAKCKGELVSEGATLNHCVGRMDYDERIAKETSLIVFIRKVGQEFEPFVTVEFSIGQAKVLQCYGRNDSQPPDDVKKFVYDVWQPRAKKALKEIKAVKEAA